MITLITGAPGTGKSAALVSLLKELSKGRAIYCNGIPDLKIDHQELKDPNDWHNEVPDGSIIVIDEVQRVWRPRGPGQKVPPDIAALETHRHRGIDFYIVTQGPRLVDSNVRALIGRHVHLRDIGVLGRYWYEWPECNDQCATAWKNAPIKKRYRLPKAIFSEYKSATEHIKPIRSFPTMLVVMVLALIVTAGLAYRTWGTIAAKINPASVAPTFGTTAPPGQLAPSTQPAPVTPTFIDDRIAWIPRVSDRPESAPAYDTIRQVINMPLVAGGVCFKGECKCVTQQGTDAGLSHALCKSWIDNPRFDPYRPQLVSAPASAEKHAARSESAPDQNGLAPERSATVVPMPSGPATNPTAEARSPSVFPPGSPFHTTQPKDAAGIIPPPSLLNPYRKTG
jgi:zona occludens toxin